MLSLTFSGIVMNREENIKVTVLFRRNSVLLVSIEKAIVT